MKVLMISRDPKILEAGTDAANRLNEYRKLFEGIDVVVIRGSILSFLQAFISAGSIAKRMTKEDWVTSQDPFEAGIVAYVIAKTFGLRLQLQLHTDCFSPHFKRLSLMNRFRSFLAGMLLPHADSIRVVSERIRRSLSTLDLKAPVQVLPILVDIDRIYSVPRTFDLREKYPEFGKIVMVLARLEREKNISLALSAFKTVLKSVPNAGLIIFGSGREEARLKRLIKCLGLEDRVRFEGWTTDPISAYKSADLMLVTSFYEGYGMNIIEALACGCSVVATDVGIARDAGATIAGFDSNDVATKASISLLNNSKGHLAQGLVLPKSEYMERFKQTFYI